MFDGGLALYLHDLKNALVDQFQSETVYIIQVDLKIDSAGAFVSYDFHKDYSTWNRQLRKGVNNLNFYLSTRFKSSSLNDPDELDDKLKSDYDSDCE